MIYIYNNNTFIIFDKFMKIKILSTYFYKYKKYINNLIIL